MLQRTVLQFSEATHGDETHHEYMQSVVRHTAKFSDFVVNYKPGCYMSFYKEEHYDIFKRITPRHQPMSYDAYFVVNKTFSRRIIVSGFENVLKLIETRYKANPQFSLAFNQYA